MSDSAAPNPLAAPIDRALRGYLGPGRVRGALRDAILAEIEAEWGPFHGERQVLRTGTDEHVWIDQTRLVSQWRAEQ
jgi:hypothetical protein